MKRIIGRLSVLLSPPKAAPTTPDETNHAYNIASATLAALIKSGVFGILLTGIGHIAPSVASANPVLGAVLFAVVSLGTTLLRLYSPDPPPVTAK